jgi:signal transduction histidine kinase
MDKKNSNIIPDKRNYLPIISILLIIALFIFNQFLKKEYSVDKLKSEISYFIDNELFEIAKVNDSVRLLLEKNTQFSWKNLNNITTSAKLGCYIYQYDSLCYWNTYTVTQNIPLIFNSQRDTIVQLNNGIYLIHQEVLHSYLIITFKALQYEYQVENSFLKPSVNPEIAVNDQVNFCLDNDFKDNSILIEKKGIYKLFGVPKKTIILNKTDQFFLFLLYLLTYLLIILTILSLYSRLHIFSKSKILFYISFVINIILIRLADDYLHFLPLLKNSTLFTTSISSIPFFEFPGNIITNSLLLFLTAYLLINDLKPPFYKIKSVYRIVGYFLITWSVAILVYYFILSILLYNEYTFITTLVPNYQTEWILLVIILFSNGILFFLLSGFSIINRRKPLKKLYLFIIPIIFLPFNYIFKNELFAISIVSWLMLTTVFLMGSTTNRFHSSILEVLLLLMLLAGASAWIINKTIDVKAKKMQEFTAQMLSQKNDPLLEYEFSLMANKVEQDDQLNSLLSSETETNPLIIEQLLINKYFNSAFEKYKIQVTVCDSSDLLEIQNEKDPISCASFFNDFKNQSGTSVLDSTLYLMDTHTENIYYLGILTFKLMNKSVKRVYLEIVATYVPEGIGYPGLLIDQRAQAYNLTNLSYARYYSGTLFYKFGDYHYSIILSPEISKLTDVFYNSNGYRHYIISITNEESVIVSQSVKSNNMILFPFSTLFLLFALIASLLYTIGFIIKNGLIHSVTFRNKLQLFIIGTIIFTIALLAMVTLIFMKNNAIDETKKQLEEKTYSVFIELQHKLANEITFSSEENVHLETLLKKFSQVFFSDINLFEPSGKLAATSRPEIEEKGLLSKIINPAAYQAIMINHQPSFITQEKIGSLTYYSSYLPLFLSKNKPQAIINLPYFARQSEISQTYAGLLATFINLAVLIGIIGTILTLLISRFLTRPLLMLKQRMAVIQIDKPNKMIYWQNNDEIGALINQYNLMVEKLEVSAELLKHSERESTWREMARQIAHEIKNPLTPMKLNVQYLEKAYQENQVDFPQKIASITKSLIEQIETLNNVANMFSEVASTPTKTTEVINMGDLISGVVELFINQTDIVFNIELPASPCYINAVENDMIRVMNNLVKNAVQSFSNQTEKIIAIICKSEMDQLTISISDNGKGIDETAQQNIFKPYFTTKTSGTGLGLAIVKSIVLESNGRIWFTSKPGHGTTFTMSFPQLKK